MNVGDLVKLKQRYSEWGCESGILLGRDKWLCRVLFGDVVLVFHKHELEVVNETANR